MVELISFQTIIFVKMPAKTRMGWTRTFLLALGGAIGAAAGATTKSELAAAAGGAGGVLLTALIIHALRSS